MPWNQKHIFCVKLTDGLPGDFATAVPPRPLKHRPTALLLPTCCVAHEMEMVRRDDRLKMKVIVSIPAHVPHAIMEGFHYRGRRTIPRYHEITNFNVLDVFV